MGMRLVSWMTPKTSIYALEYWLHLYQNERYKYVRIETAAMLFPVSVQVNQHRVASFERSDPET